MIIMLKISKIFNVLLQHIPYTTETFSFYEKANPSLIQTEKHTLTQHIPSNAANVSSAQLFWLAFSFRCWNFIFWIRRLNFQTHRCRPYIGMNVHKTWITTKTLEKPSSLFFFSSFFIFCSGVWHSIYSVCKCDDSR